MAMDGKLVAGYVILGFGGFLVLVAIILTLVVLHKRRKGKYRYDHDQDSFKVVYKMPMANGTSAKVASDMFDGRSVHTIARSEPGYTYVAPPPQRVVQVPPPPPPPPPPVVTQPVLMRSPPVVAVNPIPRAVSLDHVNHSSYTTMPRAGYRYVYPSGTTSRVLVPISKKKAKRIQKRAPKPSYLSVYSSNASNSRSVLSAPAYATSARSVTSGTGQRNKYYMYGSTPNLYAREYSQPVLMYDGKKRYFHADEIMAGRNEHVQNWLHHEHPTSLPADDHVDHRRPRSRASSVASAPTEMDARSETSQALHLRWSPRMRRKLDEKDRRENGSQTLGHEVPPGSPRRYQPLHHYTELTETF